MVKQRKKFDKEFKLMAVELIESHKTVPKVSEELGIDKSLLYQWRKSFLKVKSPLRIAKEYINEFIYSFSFP